MAGGRRARSIADPPGGQPEHAAQGHEEAEREPDKPQPEAAGQTPPWTAPASAGRWRRKRDARLAQEALDIGGGSLALAHGGESRASSV
jgi:hypothetical protein